MNEDFKRAKVISSAVGLFAVSAYFGGNALISSFDSAVKASVERNSAKQETAETSGSDKDSAPPAPPSILPKKFGVTIER